MSKEALVEREMVFGLDERAAEAIVRENDGLHNKTTVILRAAEAQDQAVDHAAA
jgi:hypothetical protein